MHHLSESSQWDGCYSQFFGPRPWHAGLWGPSHWTARESPEECWLLKDRWEAEMPGEEAGLGDMGWAWWLRSKKRVPWRGCSVMTDTSERPNLLVPGRGAHPRTQGSCLPIWGSLIFQSTGWQWETSQTSDLAQEGHWWLHSGLHWETPTEVMEVRNAWEYRRLFQEPSLCSTRGRGDWEDCRGLNPQRGGWRHLHKDACGHVHFRGHKPTQWPLKGGNSRWCTFFVFFL